ncbi:MAG: hypothetical protein KIS85_06215 [Anaerolineales bacterium]|nr:hypothetical protein [Anaerolineales bacterium]
MAQKRTLLIISLLMLASLACGLTSMVQDAVGNAVNDAVGDAVGGILGDEAGGLVDGLLGGGGAINTSSNLWIDVPRMPGMENENLELPLFMRLFVQFAIGQVLSAVGSDIDMVTFTTQHTPEDVRAFYEDAFDFSDWDTESQNCFTGSEVNFEDVGVACAFSKEEDAGEAGLIIIANRDQNANITNVYFLRVQGGIDQP